MAWRLLLSERPVRRLDLLPGKPALLAAWTTLERSAERAAERVAFLDVSTGAKVDERTLDPAPDDRAADGWQTYLRTLTAPNHDCLPFVRTRHGTLYSGANGALRLLRTPADALELLHDDRRTLIDLPPGTRISALEIDCVSGTLALLEPGGRLQLFRMGTALASVELPLAPQPDFLTGLAIAEGGALIYATDGRRLLAVDAAGKILRTLELHYPPGALAVSPDGKLIATTDLESHVLRVYNAALTLTHQRFAVDLLADTKRAQLIGGTLSGAAAGALALSNKGVLAFTLGGAVCLTSTTRMKVVSGARPG